MRIAAFQAAALLLTLSAVVAFGGESEIPEPAPAESGLKISVFLY